MDFTEAFDTLTHLNEERKKVTIYQHYDNHGRIDAEAEAPIELAKVMQNRPEFRGQTLSSISNTIRHGLLKNRPEWGKVVIYEDDDDSIISSDEEEDKWYEKGEEESKLNFKQGW